MDRMLKRLSLCALVLAATGLRAQSTPARIDSFMTRAASYRQFNGAILVVDRGREVYQRAFGEASMEWRVPNTVDTHFEIASMTISLLPYSTRNATVASSTLAYTPKPNAIPAVHPRQEMRKTFLNMKRTNKSPTRTTFDDKSRT